MTRTSSVLCFSLRDSELGEVCLVNCSHDAWSCLRGCDGNEYCQFKCLREQVNCVYNCPCQLYCLEGCAQCADHPMCLA